MRQIWAPWRMEYIKEFSSTGCFLCKAVSEENQDEKNYIVKRGKSCFAVLNKFPYNPGHVLVSPYAHKGLFDSLTDEESSEIWSFLKELKKSLDSLMSPDGFNIGLNLGRIAGAGLQDHIHVHIVPRWNADTNFMPIIADTRVVPESLGKVYTALKEKLSPPAP